MLEVLIQQVVTPPAMVRQYVDQQINQQSTNSEFPDFEPSNVGRSLVHLFTPINSLVGSLQSPEPMSYLKKVSDRTLAFAEISATPQIDRAPVPAPTGWRSVDTMPGITTYNPPSEDEVAVEPVWNSDGSNPMAGWDGTRHPYMTEVGMAELMEKPITPHQFVWNDTWQGEGYSRERDRQGQLISQREGGADIHIGISFDTSITNPNQPNLRIVLTNDQDITAQVTNLSAFLMDQITGETIDRQDFEQLPPAYEVTLTLNGGFKGTEVKTLEPSGTLVFEYHVLPHELQEMFPIRLEGINKLFNQRQQEVETLESHGWVVMEVPPPS